MGWLYSNADRSEHFWRWYMHDNYISFYNILENSPKKARAPIG